MNIAGFSKRIEIFMNIDGLVINRNTCTVLAEKHFRFSQRRNDGLHCKRIDRRVNTARARRLLSRILGKKKKKRSFVDQPCSPKVN